MKTKHPEYQITLRVLPDDGIEGDGYRRLKAFLKRAVRAYGLACVAIVPAETAPKANGDKDLPE